MPEMKSIKIATGIKDQLDHLKIHPRETYSDLISRLASQAQTELPPWQIPLIHVRINGVIRELKHPIEISVEMDEGEYILYNHEYRLLVVASDLSEGLKDIIDEFEENWNDFVLQDESALLGGARDLRRKFIALVPGET
jgi:hypothetical protein